MLQPNLVVDSGVDPPLHPNCHHQITYYRCNLNVEHPLPSERFVWDYKKFNTESINQALILTNWDHLFLNKDVHQRVDILTNTLLDAFFQISNQTIVTFDDRNLPWVTEFIKLKIQQHSF